MRLKKLRDSMGKEIGLRSIGRQAASWLLLGVLICRLGPGPAQAQPEEADQKLNVLILGDSLALCGFGKRLDERFRNDPQVKSTYTYMACGTNPLSWLKQKPYTNIKAPCGFWSIEPDPRSPQPREMQDTYGMKANHPPKPHPVPKLEDLLETVRPDILVVQTGSNLFGLFPDAKTVRRAQHSAAIRKYLLPFKEKAISRPSPLKKIYWVNPPTSGRVSKEVQDFLFEQTRKQLSPPGTVIDSRTLVTYPYKHMDPDKEHFLGEEMTQWADKVFEIIQRDLSAQPLAALKPLSALSETESAPLVAQAVPPSEVAARAEAVAPAQAMRAEAVTPVEAPPPAEPPKKEPLQVRATLVFKSQPIPLNELLPYQESLVAYLYNVDKVLKGQYDEQQILVMHPAHIALKEQKLKYKIGKRYKLRLDRMEGTLWDTAKARDETGQINLQPYIRLEDKKRHPGIRTR
ncbi:MAG: hypothetical protein ABR589_04090 [Chthoniobacterales bacterium]